MDYLKVEYFTEIDRKGFENEIGFLFKKLLDDLDKIPAGLANGDNAKDTGTATGASGIGNDRVSSATSNKKMPRPTTAKSNKSQ